MNDIIFLEPVFKEMLWGGSRMRDCFGYDIPGDDTGEAWIVSAHPQGDCRVAEGRFAGESLSSLWADHRDLFGNLPGEVFPLLVKIIDAKADLSIQVHPDDAYAREHENGALGKTECWYILDCDEGASIIVGHNADSRKELRDLIEGKQWSRLIRERPIHPGDFFQITPGTVHAIKGGTLLIETQQNSAVTYRLYDYDRLSDGKPRELHIGKSIDVIRCPHRDEAVTYEPEEHDGYVRRQLISCDYYTVDKVDVNGTFFLEQTAPFSIVSVIDGGGSVDGHLLKKGMNFILPCGYGSCEFQGEMSLILSHV